MWRSLFGVCFLSVVRAFPSAQHDLHQRSSQLEALNGAETRAVTPSPILGTIRFDSVEPIDLQKSGSSVKPFFFIAPIDEPPSRSSRRFLDTEPPPPTRRTSENPRRRAEPRDKIRIKTDEVDGRIEGNRDVKLLHGVLDDLGKTSIGGVIKSFIGIAEGEEAARSGSRREPGDTVISDRIRDRRPVSVSVDANRRRREAVQQDLGWEINDESPSTEEIVQIIESVTEETPMTLEKNSSKAIAGDPVYREGRGWFLPRSKQQSRHPWNVELNVTEKPLERVTRQAETNVTEDNVGAGQTNVNTLGPGQQSPPLPPPGPPPPPQAQPVQQEGTLSGLQNLNPQSLSQNQIDPRLYQPVPSQRPLPQGPLPVPQQQLDARFVPQPFPPVRYPQQQPILQQQQQPFPVYQDPRLGQFNPGFLQQSYPPTYNAYPQDPRFVANPYQRYPQQSTSPYLLPQQQVNPLPLQQPYQSYPQNQEHDPRLNYQYFPQDPRLQGNDPNFLQPVQNGQQFPLQFQQPGQSINPLFLQQLPNQQQFPQGQVDPRYLQQPYPQYYGGGLPYNQYGYPAQQYPYPQQPYQPQPFNYQQPQFPSPVASPQASSPVPSQQSGRQTSPVRRQR